MTPMTSYAVSSMTTRVLTTCGSPPKTRCDLGRGHFARAIDARLTTASATMTMSMMATAADRVAMSQMMAGGLIALLVWWLDQSQPPSPAAMDDLFHGVFWRGVTGWPGSGRGADDTARGPRGDPQMR
jgi:hypothetical protein